MVSWGILIARFFAFSSVLILFGSSLFYLYGFRRMPHGVLRRRWAWPHLTLSIASSVALMATIGWLMAETAVMTGEPAEAFSVDALWSVASGTTFGSVSVLRLVLLFICMVCLFALSPSRRLWGLQTLAAAVVLASFVLTGHGAMDEGFAGLLHISADALHLLAAGVWLGALVPLAILVTLSHSNQNLIDAQTTYHGLDGFSGVGLIVVSVLVLTGAINSWFLIGPANWRGVFTTPYGIALLVKLGMFSGMLALAAANRFILTPRLNASIAEGDALRASLGSLRRSVFLETSLACFVLIAVGILGILEPPVSGG